ncbi:MAG: hypothetical protein HY741_26850 [Chloroflexi bacterium]|nr:hypothetical protein [Chloroflexota bacterium]
MPDEPTRPESPAPRKAKTPRASKTLKTKAKAKTTRGAPKISYAYATETARASKTGQTLRVLEPYAERGQTAPASVAVAFVSLPGFEQAQEKLSATMQDFMRKVSEAIERVTTLDVKTYVSANIEGIELDQQGKLVGDMRLRAMTSISLTGDIKAIIPMRPEGMDETLWAAHVDMVKQAQANRTELVKLAFSAVSGLITAIKPV